MHAGSLPAAVFIPKKENKKKRGLDMIHTVKYLGETWYLVGAIWFRTYEAAARYYNEEIAENESEYMPLF